MSRGVRDDGGGGRRGPRIDAKNLSSGSQVVYSYFVLRVSTSERVSNAKEDSLRN